MNRRNVEVQVYDATVHDPEKEKYADVVLMDVPCSGLGVMGKKRDIKYHATPESLQSITELQRQIVAAGWQYVKPHGVLLYSTCTITAGKIRRWQSGSQRISRLYWKKRDSFCRERMRPTDSIMQDCAEKRER